MHNMVMQMKAARESVGIGACSEEQQDQRGLAAPSRLDATSRLKELVKDSLMASATSEPDDEAKFASSAFKQGPAPTYVPLPSRWGSAEGDNFQEDRALAFPNTSHLHPEGIMPTSLQPEIGAVEVKRSKRNKISNTLERPFDMTVPDDPMTVPSNPLASSPPFESMGPSPSSILQRGSETPPFSKTPETGAGISNDSNARHPSKGSKGKKVSSVAGAHAISERTKAFAVKKQPPSSTVRVSQRSPPKESLPGGIKLPSAVAKLLPEATRNFP